LVEVHWQQDFILTRSTERNAGFWHFS